MDISAVARPIILLLAISLAACGGGGSGGGGSGGGGGGSGGSVTLQSIAVTPATPSISKGLTQQMTATGTYSDSSSQDITASVAWTSATTSVARIDSSGLVTAVAAGTSVITATSGTISGNTTLTVTVPTWTWMGGSNVVGASGVYGTLNTPASGNMPGARVNAMPWTDSFGNHWLFGGFGYDSAGAIGELNDLWIFDGTNWTWAGGGNLRNATGVLGTTGNMPGARHAAVTWTDSSGNFWLFGGYGYDSAGASAYSGYLNDLWTFDGNYWIWVDGSNMVNAAGTYGTLNTPASSNMPGARMYAMTWIDGSGNFWLFGGVGNDSAGANGELNDLWKFDGSNWTWMGGSDVAGAAGVYGTLGTAASNNMPGARYGATTWTDSSGNFWLFGGSGYASSGLVGRLNDLWKFDGSNWTWAGGSNLRSATGVYGATGNMPGARQGAIGWTDSSGTFWLFGGHGYDSAGSRGDLNDLWKFQP